MKSRWTAAAILVAAVALAVPPMTANATPLPAPSPVIPTDPVPTPSDSPDYQQPSFPETVTQNPPAAPGKPRVQRWGKKYARIRWRAAEEFGSPVDRYLVYRSTNGTSFRFVKGTTDTVVNVKAVRLRTAWYYVVARSDAGRSQPSRTVKFPK